MTTQPTASEIPAEARDHEKGMLREVLHELKQPMLAILVLAERMERRVARLEVGEGLDPALFRKDMSALLAAIEHMRGLMATRGELTTTGMVEAGWGARISQMLTTLEAHAGARGVVLAWEGLPVQQEEGPDPRIIVQVLSNLIHNAVDAVEGCATREVRVVFVIGDDRRARVEIHDSGPGVPAAEMRRIFSKGYTTKRKSGGSGLGLWLCRRLLKALGGSVQAGRSERLGGACFSLEFPLLLEHVAPLSA